MVHTGKAGVINLYVYTLVNLHTHTCTRMCPFSFLRINLRWFQLCAEPIIIDINVWHEREGRMKYSKLSDMFSLHYLLDQKCLCACVICVCAGARWVCVYDVWQTRLQHLPSNCSMIDTAGDQCLPNCCLNQFRSKCWKTA